MEIIIEFYMAFQGMFAGTQKKHKRQFGVGGSSSESQGSVPGHPESLTENHVNSSQKNPCTAS